ncbi:MAG: diaminopimelate epimerase [Chloroflexota bacterium]|nr:diaminopimelate epimerase [Chloroflexota bacterium]
MIFAKMQATGNDFVIVEADADRDWHLLARAMCDRHFGVGADGLIVVAPSDVAEVGMRFFNPDGSEAAACGNGLRCVTRYAIDRGARGSELRVQTRGGIRTVHAGPSLIQVSMGMPAFKASEIPMTVDSRLDIILAHAVAVGGLSLKLTCLSMSNPHAVHFLDGAVSEFPLLAIGPQVENHPLFPERVNFEVANVLDRGRIAVRVWERGAGETLSCGSGACAVAVAARLHDYVDSNAVDVLLPGGTLTVDWDGEGEVRLSGPAELVFTGEWPDQ